MNRYTRLLPWIYLTLVIASAFAVRSWTFRNFLAPQGGFWFPAPDGVDHLRRISLGVTSFPRIPVFDAYMGYPHGTGQIWSPFFDYVFSALALLIGTSDQTIQTICFWANPTIAALSILLAFLVLKAFFNDFRPALIGALILAFYPGHIGYTLASHFDHHGMEVIVVILLMALPLLEHKSGLPPQRVLLATMLLVSSIFLWRGSTLFWGFAALSAIGRSAIESSRGNRALARNYAITFLAAGTAVALFCLKNPWGNANSLSFTVVSWFHVLALCAAGTCILALGSASTPRALLQRLAGILLITPLLLFLPAGKNFFGQILQGLAFINGGDPWLDSILEHKTIFAAGLWNTLTTVTSFWLLLPLALVLLIRDWLRGGRQDCSQFNLAIWLSLAMVLIHLRYLHILGLLIAFAGAWLTERHLHRIRFSQTQLIPILATVFVLFIPALKTYPALINDELPLYLKTGGFGDNGILDWIKTRTPPTSFYDNPVSTPEYGVLAPWAIGAHLYYYAHRPSISTGFGWETGGLYEMSGFMTSNSPAAATAIAKRDRVRYVLTLPLDGYYVETLQIARDGIRKGKLPADFTFAADSNDSMYHRLMYEDGSAYRNRTHLLPAAGTFRLVFETPAAVRLPGRELSWMKLFELVEGAKVMGNCTAGEQVVLDVALRTNRGRELHFHDETAADQRGGFSFLAPYANDLAQGDTTTLSPYTVACAASARRFQFTVSEAAVHAGKTIQLQ